MPDQPALRIAFCGTPEFGIPALRRLFSEPAIAVAAVITQPDRPRGRGQALAAPPIKELALAAGVPVFQPEKIRDEASLKFFQDLKPDAVVIIAYGQIIPKRLIEIPRLGWINLHASLLPKYRGAAPIHWAVANGETISGLTTMQIDPGMDTGPTLLRYEMAIGPDETAPELAARMSEAGAPLVAESLLLLDRGEISPQPQDNSQATYAPILKKEDGRIDWSLAARQIYNRIRGLAPWPGAYTTFRGQICQVWGRPSESAAPAAGDSPRAPETALTGAESPGAIIAAKTISVVCGDHTLLELESLQIEGRKRISAHEFANGARLTSSDHFGS